MTQEKDNLSRAMHLADPLPGLLLEAERVAHGFMKGLHGRRRVGSGEAFWQFRPWQQGDASRDIDWRQTGKRDAATVRQTEWEAAQTVWLYRDASESMRYHSKKDYAETLLLALAMILLGGGEQVGLLGADLPPQSGYPSVQRIYESLPLQDRLAEGVRPVAARASAIILSDFFYPLEPLEAFCTGLASRDVTGTLVQIFDPDEKTLPYRGHVRFEDIEDAAADPVLIQDVGAIRAAYETAFTAHQEKLAVLARRLGWAFETFGTDTRAETAMTKLYNNLAAQT